MLDIIKNFSFFLLKNKYVHLLNYTNENDI